MVTLISFKPPVGMAIRHLQYACLTLVLVVTASLFSCAAPSSTPVSNSTASVNSTSDYGPDYGDYGPVSSPDSDYNETGDDYGPVSGPGINYNETGDFNSTGSHNSSNYTYSGVISSYCSGFHWYSDYESNDPGNDTDRLVLLQDIPATIEIVLLDELCEDPTCNDAGVECTIGNCSACVPITDDYSNATYFTVEGGNPGSQPYEGTINCTVGPQIEDNPGHYHATCTCANQLVDQGDLYMMHMIITDYNSTVLADVPEAVVFGAGTPIVSNFLAEFQQPPVAIYHKNMLLVWLRDFMNNTVSVENQNTWNEPIDINLAIKTVDGAPAQLIINPDFDLDQILGYYFAPIAPVHTGNYIATITVGNVHISNSPFHFTVGKKYGLPTRPASSSTPLLPASWVLHLLMVCFTAGTLIRLLQGS